MQDVKLNLNLVNAVLNYLGTRPYGEVFQIVQAIQEQASSQINIQKSEIAQETEMVQ